MGTTGSRCSEDEVNRLHRNSDGLIKQTKEGFIRRFDKYFTATDPVAGTVTGT